MQRLKNVSFLAPQENICLQKNLWKKYSHFSKLRSKKKSSKLLLDSKDRKLIEKKILHTFVFSSSCPPHERAKEMIKSPFICRWSDLKPIKGWDDLQKDLFEGIWVYLTKLKSIKLQKMEDYEERRELRKTFGLKRSFTEDPLAIEKMAGLFGECAEGQEIDSVDLIRTIRGGE